MKRTLAVFRGRALAQLVQGSGFSLQHHKSKIRNVQLTDCCAVKTVCVFPSRNSCALFSRITLCSTLLRSSLAFSFPEEMTIWIASTHVFDISYRLVSMHCWVIPFCTFNTAILKIWFTSHIVCSLKMHASTVLIQSQSCVTVTVFFLLTQGLCTTLHLQLLFCFILFLFGDRVLNKSLNSPE